MQTITRNAFAMSVRMAVTTVVGLATWRIALELLGVYSLGLYAVIAGVIALGDVLYATLGGAYNRFMAFSLARRDYGISDVVATARRIQQRVTLAVFALADTAGLWYVLSLDDAAGTQAWVVIAVFQLALASSMLTILSAPARSALTALERMDIIARIDIAAGVLRLVILSLLLWMFYGGSPGTPYALALYAVVCAIVPLWTYAALWRNTHRHIGRKGTASSRLLREIRRYAAVDLYGNAAVTIRDQGVLLVFNAVGGLAATAALTLALAVVAKIQTWASSILAAFAPPIVKAYAANDKALMWHTARRALAWSLGAFVLCAIPLTVFTNTLMSLWLGPDMPPETTTLLVIALVAGVFVAATNVLASVVHATGRIRTYSLVSGTIYLCTPATLYMAALHTDVANAYAVIIPVYAAVTLSALLCAIHSVRKPALASAASAYHERPRPTHILVIIRSLEIGGAERALIDSLARHRDRPSQRIDVLALCGGRWSGHLPEYVTVLPPVWGKGERSRNLALQLRLARMGCTLPLRHTIAKAALHPGGYDIAVCWLEGLAAVAHDALWHRIDIPGHTRHYSMVHSDFGLLADHALPWPPGGRRERAYYDRCNAVIAVAPHVASSLRAFIGGESVPPIYIRPNEMDSARIQALAVAAAPMVPPRRPGVRRFVAVGRLERVKRFELLIDFAMREKANGPLEIRLIGDGSQQASLVRAYDEAGLGNIITLAGALDNPYGEIAAADALVTTSATEGDPLVVHEARALGIPVISFHTDACSS